jgi:nudix-type nucleoside diphosphatase (YffH/AdpP family)
MTIAERTEEAAMNNSPAVVVRGRRRLFDGFFKLDELTVSHRQFDGTMSADKKTLVFERGDSVAALLFNRDSNQVVLVEQFRAPTLDKSRSNGFMLEVVAGMMNRGETPEQAVIREVFEETGYRIQHPEHVATFFSSPGGTSERIFLYYAVVDDADRTGSGGGKEDEDIRVAKMSSEELFDRLRQAAIDDPKLLIAAYHLKDRIKIDPGKPRVLTAGTMRFALKANPRLVIGIKTGEIREVRDVDVWVNSENTDMMMDRIISRSISANIRYGGAEKDRHGAVLVDTIADHLRRQLNGRIYVRLGTVVETVPGALASTNGVRRIVHVATVDGVGPGKGVRADPELVSHCFAGVLDHIKKRNSGFKLFSSPSRSVVVPLLGAGEGGLSAGQVAPKLVDTSVGFFQNNPDSLLKEIYLLAYRETDKDACMKALLERPELEPM